MTMIACTLNDGFPIVHSDLLISGERKSDEFYVPAFPRNLVDFLPVDSELYPIALQRKSYIITNRICFAFSGKVWYAARFLEELRRRCALFSEITKEQISEFLDEYSQGSDFDEFSMLLIFMDRMENGYVPVVYTSGDWVKKTIPLFGDLYLSGSGADDFFAAAEYIDQTRSTNPTSPSEVVQTNMALISSILARERIHQNTFKSHWGGGIETIYFDGQKFVNLGQVTFVFNHWDLNTQTEYNYPMPSKITNYLYTDDSLFILDIEAKKWRRKVTDETVYVECDYDDLIFGYFVVRSIECKDAVKWEYYKGKRTFESTFAGMGYIIFRDLELFNPGGFHGRRDAKIEFQHGKALKIEIARHVYENVSSMVRGLNL